MTLTEKEKAKITEAIENEMNYLEEVLNDRLQENIENTLSIDAQKDQEKMCDALVFAREIFFKG